MRPPRTTAVRLAGAAVLLAVGLSAGLVGTAGATISNGSQVPGSALPAGTFAAGTPFSSGQTLEVKIPANTVFPQSQNIVIVECAAPGGVLPSLTSACDTNTVQGDTIQPNPDGSIDYLKYTVYALPDTFSLGESPSGTPVCNLTSQCVLFIGNNFNDFTAPHLWSQGFYVNPTAGDTGANPGDGSAPSAVTTPSATLSTVTAGPATAVADGTDPSKITVTLLGLNAQSQTVPVAGAPVTLGQGSGHSVIAPGSATTDGSGVATFTVTDTTIEPVTYTVTSGSVTLTHTAQATFQAPMVSAGHSTVAANPATVPADNSTTSTVTVTVRDQSVGSKAMSGVAVTLAQGAGAHSTIATVSGTTNGSGVATFTVKDSTTEPVTYTATAGGVVLTSTTAVTFGTLAVSAGMSTVTAALSPAPTGAQGGTTVTVTLLTGGGNPVPGKNVTVAGSTSGAVVNPSTALATDANGQAIFNVTDPTVETVTFSAQDVTDTLPITAQATVVFQTPSAPTPSPTLSTVTFSPATVPADATTSSNFFVTIRDTSGAPLAGKVVTVAPTPADVKVSVTPVVTGGTGVAGTTGADGLAEFQVRDTVAESVTFNAVDTTDTMTVQPPSPLTVTFTAGSVDGNQSALAASPTAVAADGSAASTVSATINDHFGNPVAGKSVTLSQGAGRSVITPASAVTDVHGVATFSVTDTTAEFVTYAALDVADNLTISQTAKVTFGTPPPILPVSDDCAIVSNSSSVPADGKTPVTITVLLFDANGVPVSGRSVSLSASRGSSAIAPVSPNTDAGGAATFNVTDSTAELVTYTAIDGADHVPVTGEVKVSFTVASPGGSAPGSGARPLNRPVVGMAATPAGRGYWLVASDGGIFSFGDARFFGSTGNLRLNQPVMAMAVTPSGQGYWLIASDGGIFSFGDAVFAGSLPGAGVREQAAAVAAGPGGGYLVATGAGHVYGFGTPAAGGPAGVGATAPTVSVAYAR